MEAADIQQYWKPESISDIHNFQRFFCGHAVKSTLISYQKYVTEGSDKNASLGLNSATKQF